jgi:hypothetical protein
MAVALRGRKRAKPEEVDKPIVTLCKRRFLTLPDQAQLIGRTYDTILVHCIARLVEGGNLEMRYPDQPTHPGQTHRALAGKPGGAS